MLYYEGGSIRVLERVNSTTGKEPLAAQEGGRTGRRAGPGGISHEADQAMDWARGDA